MCWRFTRFRGLPRPTRCRAVATETSEETRLPKLPLSKGLQGRLKDLGWFPLTETSVKLCRPILDDRDVLAVAPRGRARLLGYLVPLLDKMKTERWALDETVLVLVPSRREAEKVYTTSNALRKWSVRTILLAGEGQELVQLRSQLALLRSGVHLVICTASKMKELLQEGVRLEATQRGSKNADGPETSRSKGSTVRVMLRCVVLDDVEFFSSPNPELQGLLASLGGVQHVILASSHHGAQVAQEELVSECLKDPVFIDTGTRPAIAMHAEHRCCELPNSATRRARMLAFLLDDYLQLKDGAAASGRTSGALKAIVVSTRRELAQLAGHAMLRQKVLTLEEQMPLEEQQEILGLFKSLPGQILALQRGSRGRS